jgi:hypothetical protein
MIKGFRPKARSVEDYREAVVELSPGFSLGECPTNVEPCKGGR